MTLNLHETGPNPKDMPDTAAAEAEIARLINQAGSDPGLNRPFMEPKGAQPKRARGRPKKENPSAEASPSPGSDANGEIPPQIDPALKQMQDACRLAFTAGSGALVRYTAMPAIALHDQEVAALGDAWGAVAHKYLPDIAKTHIELIAACSVTLVVGMRLRGVVAEEIERRKMQEAKEFKQEAVKPGNA